MQLLSIHLEYRQQQYTAHYNNGFITLCGYLMQLYLNYLATITGMTVNIQWSQKSHQFLFISAPGKISMYNS